MTQHKGKIIELAIRRSGRSIAEICQKLSITRSTLYKRFKEAELKDSFIYEVGKIIEYDFSDVISAIDELNVRKMFKEPEDVQYKRKINLVDHIAIYENQLNKFSSLLSILLKLSISNVDPEIKESIVSFIKNLQTSMKEHEISNTDTEKLKIG